MGEIDITIRGKLTTYTGPASFREMEKKHLLMWADTMCSNLTTQKAKNILVGMLYGIPEIPEIPEHLKLMMSWKIKFLFKKNELSTWLIPAFYFRCRKYYGPKSKLSNITAEEFSLCELCYEKFQETKDIAFIDALVAILYRPRRFFDIDDDIRMPLRAYSREIRTKKFKKISEKMRWSIYLNYEGCRNYIVGSYREVFKPSGSTGPVEAASWSKIVQSAAGGIFGTLKETEKSNVHKFLSELNDRLIQMEKDKKP